MVLIISTVFSHQSATVSIASKNSLSSMSESGARAPHGVFYASIRAPFSNSLVLNRKGVV
jgi:hypothetical protein